MQNEIMKIESSNKAEIGHRVRRLLAGIPVIQKGFGFQMFSRLPLIRHDGVRFSLSIQGSEGHYSHPRICLPTLAEYDSVEIGILPNEANENAPYKYGTSYSYNFETEENVRQPCNGPGGWLQPKHVGFTHIQEGNDDVLGYVEVRDLVADLVEFFANGGAIDTSQEDTKKWVTGIEWPVREDC
jgi:hypothetical protein